MSGFNSRVLLQSLRYGAFSQIWALFSGWLIKWLGPEFAAWLTSLSIDHDDNTGSMVLCLSRDSFVKDIRELRKRTSFSFPMVMAGFTRFQMAWVPAPMQTQSFYQTYEGPGKEEALNKSFRYAQRLITLAGKGRKVEAVLSANFDYWQDVGFKQACRTLGIPFVVLSREHPVIPRTCDIVADWYRKSGYRFDGAAIAVAGPSTKAVLDKVTTVCRQEQVVITGLPRFDAWLDVNITKPLTDRLLITLLTFTDGYFADNTFKEVLHTFCDAARAHQDKPLKFLVKTKDMGDTIAVETMIGENAPANLIFDHEIDLFSALPESRLVINYNSLSLVEAAMARAPIALPAWGECKDRGPDVMYPADAPKIAKVTAYAYCAQQLREVIDATVNGHVRSISEEDYAQFVNEYVYIPSGTSCSAEVATLLSQCMDKQWPL